MCYYILNKGNTKQSPKEEQKMKCFRLYVDGECVGTYFNKNQALLAMGDWFSYGYDADRVELKTEDY